MKNSAAPVIGSTPSGYSVERVPVPMGTVRPRRSCRSWPAQAPAKAPVLSKRDGEVGEQIVLPKLSRPLRPRNSR